MAILFYFNMKFVKNQWIALSQVPTIKYHPLNTPVSLTHAYPPHTSPHASPRKKMLCGDAWGRPHEFPTQNVDFFFVPTKGLLLTIQQNPHLVHGNPQVNLEVHHIWGFLMDSDQVSYPEFRTMSAIERQVEDFPTMASWRHTSSPN